MIANELRWAAAFVAVVALALALWTLKSVLLLSFGAILVAILFRQPAKALARHSPLSTGVALTLLVLVVVGLGVAFWTLAGPRILSEAQQLWSRIPAVIDRLQDMLRATVWGEFLLDRMESDEDISAWAMMGTIGGTVTNLAGAVASVVVLLAIALYLAASPGVYRKGALLLVPPAHRDRGREVLDALGEGLWHWLLGQLAVMVLVAVLIGLGLWLLGVPLPFTLALIAGGLNFVPFFGPVFGAAPAILVALDEGTATALWTGALYLAVQQVEGNFIMPMVQRRATALPPALTVLAITGMGLLFGLPGVFLATPLLLVGIILVRMLWVEDTLGDRSVAEDRAAE